MKQVLGVEIHLGDIFLRKRKTNRVSLLCENVSSLSLEKNWFIPLRVAPSDAKSCLSTMGAQFTERTEKL